MTKKSYEDYKDVKEFSKVFNNKRNKSKLVYQRATCMIKKNCNVCEDVKICNDSFKFLNDAMVNNGEV